MMLHIVWILGLRSPDFDPQSQGALGYFKHVQESTLGGDTFNGVVSFHVFLNIPEHV